MGQISHSNNAEVYFESDLVARKFGLQHKSIVTMIEKLVADIAEVGLSDSVERPIEFVGHYHGADYKAYRMDRRFFSLLTMRFRGKKALEWHLNFDDAFYAMEASLLKTPGEQSDANEASNPAAGEPDKLKGFVEYASTQGCPKIRGYYKNASSTTYPVLGLLSQPHPEIRDLLQGYGLPEMVLMERRATIKLQQYMELGRNYKDIYSSVADDLHDYSAAMRLGMPAPKTLGRDSAGTNNNSK